ncbi:transient receptor potential cation channel subfamily M member-like 2 [Babylonia areolata]|uniref:transient receptor potential cation channel subfamily M member-like 2 n=1 Tax=Babylonia areolata TaxID=304850 RepID=UPI003FD3EE90
MSSPSRLSVSSANQIIDSGVSSAEPRCTESLATQTREIQQDSNFGQNYPCTNSPSGSVDRTVTETRPDMETNPVRETSPVTETNLDEQLLKEECVRKTSHDSNKLGTPADPAVFKNVYNLYNTYDTYEGSDRFERIPLCPLFPSGVVRFTVKGEEDTKDRYYMIVNKDGNMDDVAMFMGNAWRRRTPKLVLSVIGSSRYFVPWENPRFEEDFQDGIIEAANSTEMWILTDGMDIGVSKIIGDAAHREMIRRRNIAMSPLRIQNIQVERLPHMNIFGIASKSSLVYADILTGQTLEGQIVENSGGHPDVKLLELNPDHTHFILMDDGKTPDIEGLLNFRLNLEMRFTKPVGKPRRYRHFESYNQLSHDRELNRELDSMVTPVIGLLVQGGPADIDHILWLLTKKIPVVVIQGSGLAADLVSFAYIQMQQRTDAEYLDTYIKAELMRRVSEAFPDDFVNDDVARNMCRDKIIECVKLDHQDNLSFLTIINCNSHGVRLTDISKYLLTALFKSQARLLGHHSHEQLQWDLQLTVDWNRPDLARSEIFNKYKLGKFKVAEHLIHMALIRPNREEFIELFLEHGWLIHTYLNHKRLHNLFENPADKDFFVTVCLEGVIGKTVNPNNLLCHNFVDDANCELNRLLYKCTGLKKLVNPYELSMNSLGSYITDKDVAERRATNTLVLWAALTSRYKLAKLLWKHTEDPMAIALIVSMILHRLGTYWCKKDQDMRNRVKQAAAEFGKLAVTMLRLSFEESSMFTFTALSKQLEDFNNRNVVELAKLGENKYFIAHSCCQKWLTERWYGNIRVRELDWGGQFKLPEWLKIYLSVFLLIPMFVWITFQPPEVKSSAEEDDDEGQEDAQEMSMLLHMTSIEDKMHKSRKSRVRVTFKNMLDSNMEWKIPVWKRIYYLWSAPVTKFWLSQLLYCLFLTLMSVGLLMPGCGHFMLNIAIVIWTTTLWVELIRRTIIKKKLYPEVPLTSSVIEIFFISLFILLMLGLRILTRFVNYITFMTTKFLLSIFLLFFYFRFMAMAMPISPTLGPMLVSIITMIRKDFSNWMKLFFMVLVSGAVTIQATIYPYYPLGVESLRKAFSRAIFGLFLTKIDDLNGNKSCSFYYNYDEVKYCSGSGLKNKTIEEMLYTCPHGSLLNYAVVIPYLMNAKLIFITLIYAMFAVTTAKVYNESVEIWRYQRYVMIVDFEERLVLPPPFTILCYIFFILKWIGRLIYRTVAMLFARTNICCMGSELKDHASKIQIVKFRRTADYNFWKECINHYIDEEQAEQVERDRAKTQSDFLVQLLEEMRQQHLLTQHLNDRIIQLESNMTNNCVLLEEMKHMIHRLDPATQKLHQESQKLIHTASRHSPYKDTLIRRFPVFDKYVPWEVSYDTYDPGIYTAAVTSFPEDIQICVDPDVIELMDEQNKRQRLSPEELEQLPPLPEFKPLYNTVHCCIINDVNVETDRTSWMTVENQPMRYKLDSMNLPLNPMGRTGLRGRGKLWRFGPNHRIAAVVTRWRRKYSPMGFPLDHLFVDGKKVLECLVVSRRGTEELTLPGGNVYGKTSAYSVLCEEFLKSIFLEEHVEGSAKLDQDDMISYFAQFAHTAGTKQFHDPQIDMAASGFSASILYRGYIDDPTNTDNAWREAEVWNFHYDLHDVFDEKIKEREKMWQEVMPHMNLYGNQDSIVMEAARIHNAYS